MKQKGSKMSETYNSVLFGGGRIEGCRLKQLLSFSDIKEAAHSHSNISIFLKFHFDPLNLVYFISLPTTFH